MNRVVVATAISVLTACATGTPASAPSSPLVSTALESVGTFVLENLCESVAPGQSATLSTTIAGENRTVRVHWPATPKGPRPPVVLAFHGAESNPIEMEGYSQLSLKSDAEGFVVAYPASSRAHDWSVFRGEDPTNEVKLASALLDAFSRVLCVDGSRILVTGLSAGGAFADLVACRFGERLRGVAVVAGRRFGDPCTSKVAVPFLAINAVDDTIVPYRAGTIENASTEIAGAEKWVGEWAKRNRCKSGPVVSSDREQVDRLTWRGCKAPVTLIRLASGGHSWPLTFEGQPIDAVDVVWSFFADQI